MNLAAIFLLFWSSCSLASAKKEYFFFLFFLMNYNLIFLAVLPVKLWFSGVDTTRFHNLFWILRHEPIFHVFFSIRHTIYLLTDHILHYLRSKKRNIWTKKVFKGIDYGFMGFDTPFSKTLIGFFYFCL